MKKACLLLFACLCIVLVSKAQDVITLLDGKKIHAKEVEITPTQIIYKKKKNHGRDRAVMKTGVETLVYPNGTKIIYNRPGHAPEDKNMDEDKKDKGKVRGIYVAAALAGGLGTVTNQDQSYSVSTTIWGSVNFLATPMISQHFGIQFGIGGESYGYHVNYNAENNYFSGQSNTYVQRYLNVPVRLLYLSNSRRRLGFYVNAGIDLSILANATDDQNVLILGYYRDVLVSPYGSCGAVFRNEKASCIWMLGPFYKTTLNNIYSGQAINYDAKPFMGSGNVGNFTTIGVTLSFMTNFGMKPILVVDQ